MRSPCAHAVATTPAEPLGLLRSSVQRSAFPERERVGLRIVLFEACSAFTHVSACTLALPPFVARLPEGFSHFVTSMTAPVACMVSWLFPETVGAPGWRGLWLHLPFAQGQTPEELPHPHRQASMRNLAAGDRRFDCKLTPVCVHPSIVILILCGDLTMQTETCPLHIGADVAKDEIVVACEEQYFAPRAIDNRRSTLTAFLESRAFQAARSAWNPPVAIMSCSPTLAHKMGFVVFVLNPKDTRHYAKAMGLRGKTDRVDAKLIARFGRPRARQAPCLDTSHPGATSAWPTTQATCRS